ncbi:uncharacterized protein LOC133304223 [Gastrolobium bilobum]|uniref:uncharacterized protein LOC133304223 n=1 Tax=Gastrolobium bilobum TaxID=150636 RepID=UPI002AB2C2D4|nr:uncharacterized protein LOC133304223 [Gastrolobium bilobum]
MNHYYLQQNDLVTLEDMRGHATISDQKGTVICPKPRRFGVVPNMPTRPLRLTFCQEGEGPDSKAGAELLDIISKERYDEEQHANNEASSSPPYFLGSPPVRADNPFIQDAQFGYEKDTPQSTPSISSSPGLSSPSSSASSTSCLLSPSSPLRKGGCVRMKFGIKSATVRVVGFNCHVPAFA